MSEEKLLTVRDVSALLGISEKEVLSLAESGSMPAYKIGGVYLRFKRDQILEYRKSNTSLLSKQRVSSKDPLKDKVGDFFYFNDFYILTALIIILLLTVIFRGF